MQRRLLTSMLGVAVAAVLVFGAGLAVTALAHGPARAGVLAPGATARKTTAQARTASAAPSRLRVSPAEVGLLAVLALMVAAALAGAQARRLARPVRELARAADRIGSGDARPVGRRYGIAELDRVAEGLDNSAKRVSDLISAEQDFAVDASHQLRTPLTALSMRLEEMVAAADDPDVVREEGAAALAQTDRLAQVVAQLLGRARRSSSGAPTLSSIDDIIGQQVVEWDPAFRAVNRKLEVLGDKGLRAYVSSGGASQVVATLLDNALVHGGGTVTIRTSQTPRSVVIEVRDEGKGVPADLVHRVFERSVSGAGGTGLGLALAKSVASSDGGQLVLVRPRPATFAVIFPQPVTEQLDEPVVAGPA
ncbi:MAG TPA: HAMP domain-containing sensor histidine kinase [Streptosporangiaceae bacterium]|nr:HAMP domain-containing sensor histidine kinase [Streptosporangiaceae bacterium]